MHPETEQTVRETLRSRFGFTGFRAGQREIISAVLAGRDALGVMPTGGGKSLGFCLPALLLEQPVLVVSPLIALMKDQVDGLAAKRIPAGYVNSTVPPYEQERRIEAFRNGSLRLLFVAPERFRSSRFLEALDGFRPGLFAVDEAHCISEWGHDFRPDYLRLQEAAERVGRPPILALTATATRQVRQHISKNLGLKDPLIVVEGFERKNLDFLVTRTISRVDKFARAVAEVRKRERGIVYAATRKNVEKLALALRDAGLKTGFYHAGLADGDRRAVQERFRSGELPVVVATNAFGMGIDRPDLRFVMHLDLPGSVEAYTQEAGRAGRDDKPARCSLLYQPGDARLQRFFIETSYPPPEVIRQTRTLIRDQGPQATISELHLAAWVTSASHPRAVDSALRILSEHGVVARSLGWEAGTRMVRFLEDRPIDYELLRARAERDFERLRHIVEYAEQARCHRAYLVNYFAGEGTAAPCGSCAACRAATARRPVSDAEAEAVHKLLELLRTLSGRYGKRKLLGILAGSRTKDLLAGQLDQHRCYGSLRHLSMPFLDSLLAECLATGLARIEGGEYPVVALTKKGSEVLSERSAPRLSCFDQAPKPKGKAREVEQEGECDPELLARLRSWRAGQAEQEGVPLYRVLSNRTLEDVVRRMPATGEELLEASGIGPAKLAKYGAEILGIVGRG
ncbi:MAG: ATP-dependent DNA helicase RecQ [Planctomycetota bacterium]